MTGYMYLYFPTPEHQSVPGLIESILAAGISVSHFGRTDPPRKWSGDVQAMARLLLDQPEQNKYAFFRDSKQKLDLTLEVFYDPRWTHSTLSISAPAQERTLALARVLSQRINPYLCIHNTSDGGKDQEWLVMHERADCPEALVSRITRAR